MANSKHQDVTRAGDSQVLRSRCHAPFAEYEEAGHEGYASLVMICAQCRS